jgi:hypothetical protein
MRGDIEVGARLPDYELPDQDGVVRRLSDLQGSNPMVLHLSRGGFDPKEHRFLHMVSVVKPIRANGLTEEMPAAGAAKRPKRYLGPGPRSDQAPQVTDRASVGPTTRS